MLARRPISPFVLILAVAAMAPSRAFARVDHPVNARTVAIAAATHDWKALAADRRKRDRRDLWLQLIARFERLASESATSGDRGLALLRAAEATENMASISRIKRDYARAADAFRHAADAGGPEVSGEAKARAIRVEVAHLGGARPAAKKAVVEAEPEPEQEPVKAQTLVKAPEPVKDLPLTTTAFASPSAEESSDAIGSLIGRIDDVDRAPLPKATAEDVKKLRSNVLADDTMSLSEQMGLKVRRIIVDPGHGGHDEGASGKGKTHEKDVTLAIAKELARNLRERGYEVFLTREKDEYVSLEERTEFANKHKGDLFVSVHANASPSRQLSGVETYSLNTASNRFAMRLAARENATLATNVSDLQYVLADLATRANTVDSDRLARSVQGAVVDGVAHKFGRPKDNGVKHALFYVLLGTKMPAVLVETQFISNPKEEKRLASANYQAVVARSIATGVDQFVARRQPLASIDR